MSTSLVKSGHNLSGTRQYLCGAFGAHRVLVAKNREPDPARKALVLHAVGTGRLSLRAAERFPWNASPNGGQVPQKKAAALPPPLNETLLPAEQGELLELDELWRFVGSKANARWVWLAPCHQTRQVVAFFVEDRSAESARVLRARIPAN